MTNPSAIHQGAAERILRYLGHTKYYSIVYDAQTSDPRTVFLASSDASFADDPETRYSSQCYGFKLFGGMIDWRASKQKTVTTSTAEAELLAVSKTGGQTLWWDRFFGESSLDPGHTTQIECDNMQTIRILNSANSQYTTKLRHVDVHHHWLRQEVAKKTIIIKWTASASILADGLTKALAPQRHKEFIKLLGIQNCKPISDPNSSSKASASNADIPTSLTSNGETIHEKKAESEED